MKTYLVLDIGNDNYKVLKGSPQKQTHSKLVLGKTYSGDELEKLGYELDKEEGLEERVWVARRKK
jgi:hypothetical protein